MTARNFSLAILLMCGVGCSHNDGSMVGASQDPADSTIAQFSLSAGTLVPAFTPDTTSYSVSMPYSVSSLQLTPTLGNPGAVMTVNGTPLSSGEISAGLPLAVGANTVILSITSPDQSSTSTYTIAVTRIAGSTDDNLTGLSLSPGALTPSFSAATTSYTAPVSDLAAQLQVTATASFAAAAVEVSWNGGGYSPLTSGQPSSSLTPAAGVNALNVRVTSETGASKIYSVSIVHGLCAAGYYDDGTHACVPVSLGYFSPAADNSRTACANKPANARYTSSTAASASCPWSCNDGYLTTDGATCNSYPNATVLSCNDDEVAVGLYGRSGAIADRLGVRCASFIDGVVGTVVRDGPYYGGTGGSAFSADCGAGGTALEIDGDFADWSGEQRTGRLRYRCIDTSTSVLSSWLPGTPSYWGTSSGLGAFNYACGSGANPHGDYVNGIIIDNAGGASYVGKILGITCR